MNHSQRRSKLDSRDIDYLEIDRELSAIHPEHKQSIGRIDGAEDVFMHARVSNETTYEQSNYLPDKKKINRTTSIYPKVLFIAVVIFTVAVFTVPKMNQLVNSLLQKAGVFQTIYLIQLSDLRLAYGQHAQLALGDLIISPSRVIYV